MKKAPATTVVVYDVRSDVRKYSTLVWADDETVGFAQLIEVLDGIRSPEDIDRLTVEKSPSGYHSSDANTLPVSDAPWLCSGFIVLSQRAVDALSDIIGCCGKLCLWGPSTFRQPTHFSM